MGHSTYQLVFTKSLHSLAGQSCDREIGEFSYSAFIYRPHSPSLSTGYEGELFCFKGPGAGIELELHSPSWPFAERLILIR